MPNREPLGPEVADLALVRRKGHRLPRLSLRKGRDWGTGLLVPFLVIEIRFTKWYRPKIRFCQPPDEEE